MSYGFDISFMGADTLEEAMASANDFVSYVAKSGNIKQMFLKEERGLCFCTNLFLFYIQTKIGAAGKLNHNFCAHLNLRIPKKRLTFRNVPDTRKQKGDENV